MVRWVSTTLLQLSCERLYFFTIFQKHNLKGTFRRFYNLNPRMLVYLPQEWRRLDGSLADERGNLIVSCLSFSVLRLSQLFFIYLVSCSQPAGKIVNGLVDWTVYISYKNTLGSKCLSRSTMPGRNHIFLVQTVALHIGRGGRDSPTCRSGYHNVISSRRRNRF